MNDCIFCKIIANEIPSSKIWENDKFFAFLDINPVNPGHTLLIPKEHVDYIFDIKDPLYSEFFQTAKKISGPLKNAMKAKRIGIVVEGLLVPHAHIHLIPLNGPGEMEPKRHIKMSNQELTEVAEKIRKHFTQQ